MSTKIASHPRPSRSKLGEIGGAGLGGEVPIRGGVCAEIRLGSSCVNRPLRPGYSDAGRRDDLVVCSRPYSLRKLPVAS